MKHIIYFFVLFNFFASCDTTTCFKTSIKNDTDDDLILEIFEKSESNSIPSGGRRLNILPRMEKTFFIECTSGPEAFSFNSDSIRILSNEIVKKVYLPNSSGNNIFKVNDRTIWQVIEDRRKSLHHQYTIREEDFE